MSEELLRIRLKKLLKGQARYILDNKNSSPESKKRQMQIIEDMMKVLEPRIYSESEMKRIEEEDMGYER